MTPNILRDAFGYLTMFVCRDNFLPIRQSQKGSRLKQKKDYCSKNMEYLILLSGILFGVILVFDRWVFKKKRERRRNYYQNEYIKSDDWKRKRYVVLKRDNWYCVYCGAPATQVHHKKYARRTIGREPIEWLVSGCKSCHESLHN